MNAPVKIAIVDDDFSPIFLDSMENTKKYIYDETSIEYENLINFIMENGIYDNDFHNMEWAEIEGIFRSQDFVKKVFKNENFDSDAGMQKLNAIAKSDIEAIELTRSLLVFEKIRSAFPPENFSIEEHSIRPDSPALTDYDLVIMDVMMNDQYNTPEEVAKYLSLVVSAVEEGKALPAFILMSSRPELNEVRNTIRKHAQISTLGFSILQKSDIEAQHGADRLQLIWSQMSKNKDIAKKIRQFYMECEASLKVSWQNTVEALWNIDAAFLQKINEKSKSESYPFEDHVLDLIGRHHLYSVENNFNFQLDSDNVKSLSAIKKHLNARDVQEKFVPSFSKESPEAIHRLTSAFYFSGISPNWEINFDFNFSAPVAGAEAVANDPYSFVENFPFGSVFYSGNSFKDPDYVLIHCTQQCDLLRNVLKHDMSLIFIEAKILSSHAISKDDSNRMAVFPVPIFDDEKKYYMHINLKKIVALPAVEMVSRLKSHALKVGSHHLRPDIARQIRQEAFNNFSRIEKPVSTNVSILKAKILLAVNVAGQNRSNFWFNDKNDIESSDIVLLSQFDDLHLAIEESLEVALWIKGKLDSVNFVNGPAVEIIENSLRNQLPKIGKNKVINNVLTIFCQKDVSADVAVQRNSAIIEVVISE